MLIVLNYLSNYFVFNVVNRKYEEEEGVTEVFFDEPGEGAEREGHH